MKVFISATMALTAATISSVSADFPANVQALIDPSVDPCEDFYQYSCGSWLKANPLSPSDVTKDYSFTSVGDRNDLVIQQIVKENWPLVGEFWDSCLDTNTLETVGNKPLQAMLTKVTSAATKSDVMRLAGELSRIGAQFVTEYSINGDYKDAKSNIMYLGNADLVLPDVNTYLNDAPFKAIEPDYRKYITTVMTLSGYNVNGGPKQQGGAQANATVVTPTYFEDTVIAVEKKLANMLLEVKGQSGDDAYYIPAKLGDVMAKYPLSIGAYFNGVGILEKSKLTKESKVIMNYLDYFEISERVLGEIDIKDLKTYIAFLYVNNRVRHLSEGFYDAYFQFFSKKLNGQPTRSTRTSICTYRMTQFFPDLVGKYYFMKMFDKEREDSAQLMTKLIEEAMGQHIQQLDWLDNATRLEAAGKLAKVANLIGQSKVKQSYPFVLKRDEFFNNINSILTNDYEKKMKKLGNPLDRELWSKSPAEVNAYYSPLENKMVFPAAILQAPFFNGSAHPAQNFGSIGAVIGHELTHGFDSSGRRFDGDGNKRNWWTESTGKEFDKRAQCMQNQYSSFIVTGDNGRPLVRVNGVRTIGENIADNGGFSLTWDAYHAYAQTTKFNDQGVSANDADKLLFLSFAQTWCGRSRDDAMKNQIATDPHSPGQWRANGVAMNNENFAKTFQCKSTAKMNPATRCKLW